MPVDKISRRQNIRDALGAGGFIAAVTALCIVFSLLVWGASVLLSPLFGAGNVHRDVNSAQNREHWSAVFNGEYNIITADAMNVKIVAESLHDSKTEQDRIDLQGAVLNCQQDVAHYNGDVQNVLAAKWLPPALPDHVDSAVCSAPPSATPGDSVSPSK